MDPKLKNKKIRLRSPTNEKIEIGRNKSITNDSILNSYKITANELQKHNSQSIFS